MATNKFPLIYSAYDNNQKENYTTSNPLGLAKSIGGVAAIGAPILAAGMSINKRMASNEFKTIAGLKSNALNDASAKVGDSLRHAQDAKNRLREIKQEEFKKMMFDGRLVDEIGEAGEKGRRAILNGLLEALNETSIDAEGAGVFKRKIQDLVQSEFVEIDAQNKQILKDTFSTLKNSNPDLFGRMKSNINFYKNVQDSLAAPLQFSGQLGNAGFNKADMKSFGVVANNRMAKIRDVFAETNLKVESVLVNERLGNINANALYAKITDKKGMLTNFIPVDISNVKDAIGASVIRMGHGQQSYVMPMAIGKGMQVQKEYLSSGKTFTAKDIENSLSGKIKNQPFMHVEDFIVEQLQGLKEKSGGVFRNSDFKILNEDLRGISENINRTFANDEFSKMSQKRVRSVGSSIGFVLDGLSSVDRREFSANVIASQADMGLLTGHSNLQISNMNNFNMVNLVMTDGMEVKMGNTFAGGAKSFAFKGVGLENTFHLGGIAMSDVTHSVLPLTARPKQFFNNDNFFSNKVGKGTSPLDVRKGRSLMLLDMKGRDRLGLSEGEAYLSKGMVTKKIFPKTVIDPKSMGYAGTDLLNELVRRSNQNLPDLVIGKGEVFRYGKEVIGIGNTKANASGLKVTESFTSVGDFFRKYGAAGTGALPLGKLDSKVSEVPFFRGTERVQLGIVERTTETGADQYKIVGMADLIDDSPKIFAEEAKTTVKSLKDSNAIDRLFNKRYGDIGFGKLNIQDIVSSGGSVGDMASTVGATEGAMLKKAHYYHARQMASAAEVFAGSRGLDTEASATAILKRAEAIRLEGAKSAGATTFKDIQSVKQQQKLYTSSFVQSISEFMGSKEFTQAGGAVTSEELGRTFGGFFRAFNDPKEKFSSMTSNEVMSILKKNVKGDGDFFKSVDKEIQKGLAVSLSSLRPGPDLATYRANQASMEARLFNFLGMKLTKVGGLNANETSDFLFSLMSRKTDAGNELIALKEYLQFHDYAKSQESIFDAKMYKDMERVSLENFAMLKDEKMDEFLKSRKSGFLLEFGEGTSASKALNKVFKGKGSMYIPAGAEFMEAVAASGTEMMKKEGTVRLPGEYKAQMRHFASNLSDFINPSEMSMDRTRKAEVHVRNFEKKMAEISSSSFINVMKGKMTGSASLRSAGITLDPMSGNKNSAYYGGGTAKEIARRGTDVASSIKPSLDLTKKERTKMNNIASIAAKKRGGGQIAFVETQGFLATMNDFMEGAKTEYLADDMNEATGKKFKNVKAKQRYALTKAREDAAKKFESFFLGSHENYAKNKYTESLTGIISRHPILSSGHVQASTLLRFTPETMQGNDVYIKNLLGSAGSDFHATGGVMDRLQQAFGDDNIFLDKKNYLSFEKLSNLAAKGLNKEQRNALTGEKGLFTFMAQNIGRFQEGEGAGRIFFPDMEVDVHYGQDKVKRINLSLASAAIGDMDGDLFQLIMPSQRAAKTLNERLMNKASQEVMADEMLYRSSLRLLFDEAGTGVENLANSLGGASDLPKNFLKDVGMKEIIGKDVGRIDVALDRIRMGMVNMDFSKEQLRSVQTGLSLLTVLEEVGTIKGKKLPIAVELGKYITEAANIAVNEGDVSKLRNITTNFAYKGVDLQELLNPKGLDLSGLADKNTRQSIEAAFKNAKNSLGDLDEVFKMILQGAIFSNKIGADYAKTKGGFSRAATNQKESRMNLQGYLAATNENNIARMAGRGQDGVFRETGRVIEQTQQAVQRLRNFTDKRMLGPAIAGIAGALGLAGVLGSSGSNPEPLLMPGEVTDGALGQKIAAGQLFDMRGASTDHSNYIADSTMNERPILTGETRVNRNSGYIINGELPNSSAMHRVQEIMNSIGGTSNFVVNDTRGPISMNFVNKHMGE
jgi:hypothetical protein